MPKYRDLDLVSSSVDTSCKTITRQVMRVGHADDRGDGVPDLDDLKVIASNFKRYRSLGGVVPVQWLDLDHPSDRAGEVIDLAVVGNSLMAMIQACGDCRDLGLLSDLPEWKLTVADRFTDTKGNVYYGHLVRITASKPTSPASRNLSSNPSKEKVQMARNYSLVRKHVLPSRRDWLLKNAPRQRVRNLSIASDTAVDGISIPDFVRYWNLLIAAARDPGMQDFEIKSTPATAGELEMMLKTFEGIIRKRVQLEDENEFDPNQDAQDAYGQPAGITPQNLSHSSLQQRSRDLALQVARELANKCRDRLPFGRLNEQDQDARMRKFWGK